MTEEMRKRLEEAAVTIRTEIINGITHAWLSTAIDKATRQGFELGYKEAITLAKEWIIEHTGCDVECNENGEPLADSYIKGRKVAIEIATIFEADMNKLWEGKE